MTDIAAQLAQEIRIRPQQAQAAIDLLDSGATVPFIARYRKEVTDGLDDIQLRELEARLSYVRELIARRLVVLSSIEEQEPSFGQCHCRRRDQTRTRRLVLAL